MKKIRTSAASILAAIMILSYTGCAKKNESGTDGNCKNCKAFATSSAPEVNKQVCSDQEEQNFRSQYSTREISCN